MRDRPRFSWGSWLCCMACLASLGAEQPTPLDPDAGRENDTAGWKRVRDAQGLIADGNHVAGFNVLQAILNGPESYVRKGPAQWLDLHEEANRVIAASGEKALAYYRDNFRHAADEGLVAAAGSFDELRSVATRYWHADAGYEALRQLARNHLVYGRHAVAAEIFRELEARPEWKGRATAADRKLAARSQQPASPLPDVHWLAGQIGHPLRGRREAARAQLAAIGWPGIAKAVKESGELEPAVKQKIANGLPLLSGKPFCIDTGAPVHSLSFSPDGMELYVSTDNEGEPPQPMLQKWDLLTGKVQRQFENAGTLFALSPDGRRKLLRNDDGALYVAEIEAPTEGRRLGPRLPGGDSANRVVFSPGGERAFVSYSSQALRIWNLETGTAQALQTSGPSYSARALSPDGKWAITTSVAPEAAQLWDVTTKKIVKEIEGEQAFGEYSFSPDGKEILRRTPEGMLAVGSADGKGAFSFRPLRPRFAAQTARYAPDGRVVAGGRWGEVAILGTGSDGKPADSSMTPLPVRVMRLAFSSPSPGGPTWLAFAARQRHVCVTSYAPASRWFRPKVGEAVSGGDEAAPTPGREKLVPPPRPLGLSH